MENFNSLILRQLDNVFLIDWLTVTFHGLKYWDVQSILGLTDSPWVLERKFTNGYPLDLNFGHIHIRYGADDVRFYDDPSKARTDMGICLDLSGQGCREFETYSNKSWQDLISDIFRCGGVQGATFNVTRLDLAYDDHSGLLNIWRMKNDIEDRNFVSKSRKSFILRSDDIDNDIIGLTLEIGSRKSEVLLRIYDKAAERGYTKEKHWIRVELQLRSDRAGTALKRLYQMESIGMVASGIIRNYCMFVTPTSDSNKSRWPIAEYWQRVLDGMEKIRIWIAPGEEYNFSKTEHHLIHQYGQALQVLYHLTNGDLNSLYTLSVKDHPQLKPKYQKVLDIYNFNKAQARNEVRKLQHEADQLREEMGFSTPEAFIAGFDTYVQSNFAELLVPDPNLPFGD